MHLRRFQLSEFIKPGELVTTYPITPKALKICCVCHSDDPEDNDLNNWVQKLGKAEIGAFRNGMSTILKLANAGRKLETYYDEKKCHETHTFTHQGKDHVIWRVRNSDVRLLFYYGNDQVVLLVDSFSKHKNKLTSAQKSHAETVVKAYLDAKEMKILELEVENPEIEP